MPPRINWKSAFSGATMERISQCHNEIGPGILFQNCLSPRSRVQQREHRGAEHGLLQAAVSLGQRLPPTISVQGTPDRAHPGPRRDGPFPDLPQPAPPQYRVYVAWARAGIARMGEIGGRTHGGCVSCFRRRLPFSRSSLEGCPMESRLQGAPKHKRCVGSRCARPMHGTATLKRGIGEGRERQAGRGRTTRGRRGHRSPYPLGVLGGEGARFLAALGLSGQQTTFPFREGG